MDDVFRKIGSFATADIAPPILMRRRLSAPETIMRKHILAQQRSSSQDSDRSQNSESTQSCQWPLDTGAGSDSNLVNKRNTDVRKSMLIKRFCENSKLLPFPRTYSEWQYSFGKMNISSPQSTPEHLEIGRKGILEFSPQHKRISPKHLTYASPIMKTGYKRDYSRQVDEIDFDRSTLSNEGLDKSMDKRTTESEDLPMYSSNFSNATSTDSIGCTSKIWEEQTSIIHSDSAYTKGHSNTPQVTPERFEDNNPHQTYKTYQVNSKSIPASNTRLSDLPVKYQFLIRDKSNADYELLKNEFNSEVTPKSSNESSTQTSETTNLNVISNVHLSESTLNLIFSQVMQDLFHRDAGTPEPVEAKQITVQNIPIFNFPKQEISSEKDHNKNQISEVNIGSPYRSKPAPLVPRLSAMPRTTSMEVNISSNESIDKESDSGSLVDSLEEAISLKDGKLNHDDKLVRGELSLLPDNSEIAHTKTKDIRRSSVFYIPMENEDVRKIEDEPNNANVSSLLPNKLKQKLIKRQIKREEKMKENTMRSFTKTDFENGNEHPYFISSPNLTAHKQKPPKRVPSTLPFIENKKGKPADIEKENKHKNTASRRHSSKNKDTDIQTPTKIKSFWLPKQYPKPEKSSPDVIRPMKQHCMKFTEQPPSESKEVEILEIMEIVEPACLLSATPRVKSKIPVLVQKSTIAQKNQKPVKPTFLDFGNGENDPKLDQLIANILIDSLNRTDVCKTYSDAEVETDTRNFNRGRYTAKFDSIPEEKQHNSDSMSSGNSNPNMIEKAAEFLAKHVLENNNLEQNYSHNLQTKEKVDPSKIPKGWITFYMLQKNDSPDSTSDEGPNTMATEIPKSTQLHGHTHYEKPKKLRPKELYKDSDYKSEDYFESDWESEPKYKHRRMRQEHKTKNNGWSVTVSGTTSGQPGPDLEMRLKFPQLNQQYPDRSRHKSDVGIQKGNSSSFPPLSNKKGQNREHESGFSFEDMCPSKMATEISKSKQYLKNCESVTRHSSVVSGKFEPRPTKTSKQRCLLNHPANRRFHKIVSPLDRKNRNLHHILDKFPDLLAISGSAVNQESKTNLPSINERDFNYILSHYNNQKNA